MEIKEIIEIAKNNSINYKEFEKNIDNEIENLEIEEYEGIIDCYYSLPWKNEIQKEILYYVQNLDNDELLNLLIKNGYGEDLKEDLKQYIIDVIYNYIDEEIDIETLETELKINNF